MPDNIIAKKLSLSLDAIKQKIFRTDFTTIIGDSIEITINITENNTPKDITGCSCRFIGVKYNGDYFEQTEKINVVDGLNGVIKIYPRLDVFNTEGQTVCGLIIEYSDESINIQRFSVNVSKSMATDIIVEVKDDLETLAKLNKLLDEYEANLISINQQVTDLQASVDNRISEINTNFNNLEQSINNDIQELNNIISGIDDTVKYDLVKGVKLSQYRLSGSNFIYMTTDAFDIYANDLLKRSYIVGLGGVVESGSYNTATGILSFYKQNGKIYPMYISLSDRMINSKNLSPSIVFSDLSSEILPNVTGFKIMVKSNISKLLNTESDTYCVFTPIAIQG